MHIDVRDKTTKRNPNASNHALSVYLYILICTLGRNVCISVRDHYAKYARKTQPLFQSFPSVGTAKTSHESTRLLNNPGERLM